MECKLKKKCPNPTADLLNCWFEQCTGWIHKGCCNLLLDKYEVPSDERPSAGDVQAVTEEPVVFCTKGCHAKWRSFTKKKEKEAAAAAKAATKKKRKVPWEEDGSMDVLMEWLTTEGNYASYCGGAGAKAQARVSFRSRFCFSSTRGTLTLTVALRKMLRIRSRLLRGNSEWLAIGQTTLAKVSPIQETLKWP
jgi:hypothetical protein